MGNALVPVTPAVEGEIYESGPATVVDMIFDEYVDYLPADDVAITTSLDLADEEALEQGIASVFDTLLAEAHEVEPTYALLAELDRLWSQPLAA
jgi:hypothetical protein